MIAPTETLKCWIIPFVLDCGLVIVKNPELTDIGLKLVQNIKIVIEMPCFAQNTRASCMWFNSVVQHLKLSSDANTIETLCLLAAVILRTRPAIVTSHSALTLIEAFEAILFHHLKLPSVDEKLLTSFIQSSFSVILAGCGSDAHPVQRQIAVESIKQQFVLLQHVASRNNDKLICLIVQRFHQLIVSTENVAVRQTLMVALLSQFPCLFKIGSPAIDSVLCPIVLQLTQVDTGIVKHIIEQCENFSGGSTNPWKNSIQKFVSGKSQSNSSANSRALPGQSTDTSAQPSISLKLDFAKFQ